jgi:hypothetical protein
MRGRVCFGENMKKDGLALMAVVQGKFGGQFKNEEGRIGLDIQQIVQG